MAFDGILQEPKSWGQESNNPRPAPISSFIEKRTGLKEGGRGPGTNLALQHPWSPPPLRKEGRRLQWILLRALCALAIQLSPPHLRAHISGLPTSRVASVAAAPAEPRAAPARSVAVRPQSPPEMPVDFTGYWKMLANENFEEYLRALGKPLLGELGPGAPPDPSRGSSPEPGKGRPPGSGVARSLRIGG